VGGTYKEASLPREFNGYKNVDHIFNNNIYYIAGLMSLKSWYRYIRPLFIYDDFSGHLIKGMQEILDDCIVERITRLNQFFSRLKASQDNINENRDKVSVYPTNYENVSVKMSLAEKIFELEFKNDELCDEGEAFIKIMEKKISTNGKNYIRVIKNLEPNEQKKGSTWLLHIEQSMVEKLLIRQE